MCKEKEKGKERVGGLIGHRFLSVFYSEKSRLDHNETIQWIVFVIPTFHVRMYEQWSKIKFSLYIRRLTPLDIINKLN